MKLYVELNRKLQVAKRQHRFVQRRECFVVRYMMSTLSKKKLIFNRINVDSKIIIKAIKVHIIENNQVKFVDNKKEKSIKKKRFVERDVVNLDKK
jgi:hypothetical protein